MTDSLICRTEMNMILSQYKNGSVYPSSFVVISSAFHEWCFVGNKLIVSCWRGLLFLIESNQISQTPPSTYPFAANEQGGYILNPNYNNHRNICVHLDHTKPRVWRDAKVVYVFKVLWDVALLQLEPAPDNLLPNFDQFPIHGLRPKPSI